MLRVQHLAGYGLEVPDVSVAEDFYTAFGLSAERKGALLQLSSKDNIANGAPADIVILKAPINASTMCPSRSGPRTSKILPNISRRSGRRQSSLHWAEFATVFGSVILGEPGST